MVGRRRNVAIHIAQFTHISPFKQVRMDALKTTAGDAENGADISKEVAKEDGVKIEEKEKIEKDNEEENRGNYEEENENEEQETGNGEK